MRKTSKMLTFALSATMAASLCACSGSTQESTGSSGASKESTAPTQSETPSESETTPEPQGTGVVVESGKGIDFEDGNFSFLTVNTEFAGSGAGDVSVTDINGSKALKISAQEAELGGDTGETVGKAPAITIDAAGLLGESSADVASVQMDVTLAYADGTFRAASGTIYGGNSAASVNKAFSVYLSRKNPSTIKLDGIKFKGEETDCVTISLNKTVASGGQYPDVYVDNIIFLDASGKAMAVDSSVEFNEACLGKADWSNNVKEVYGEVDLGIGGHQQNNWWPEACNSFTFDKDVADAMGYAYVDPAVIGKDSVFTIYFSCDDPETTMQDFWKVPYIRVQQWEDLKVDGQQIKTYNNTKFKKTDFEPVINKDGDGKLLETTFVNNSWTILQITNEQIVEATGVEDWYNHVQFLGVADKNNEGFTIAKVTVGRYKTGPVTYLTANENSGTCSNWGQAWRESTLKNDGGTLDPEIFKPGVVFEVQFLAEEADAEQPFPLEMICQSWSEAADGSKATGWAKVAPFACGENTAWFSYDDIVNSFKSDNFAELLDAVYVGDCNSKLTVTSVGYMLPEGE